MASTKKNKRKARKAGPATSPGKNRQTVLRVMRLVLMGDMWDYEVAKKAGVSVRTLYRIITDAKAAGFNVWKDDGKFFATV